LTSGPPISDVVVRDARRADVAAIVGLLADDFLGATREDPGEPLDPRYYEAFDRISGDPHHRLVVAEADGRVVGTLQITWLSYLSHRGAERALVESVHVAGDQRNRRIGLRLMEWAIALATERGCAQMQLTSNLQRPDAHRFYERMGFAGSHVGFKLSLPRQGT
jgi:GNAT superfamily N-acetyltransferase